MYASLPVPGRPNRRAVIHNRTRQNLRLPWISRTLGSMTSWRDERIQEIRDRLVANDEGALWLLFLDDPYGPPILASAIDGAMAEMNAQLTRNVAVIVNQLAVKAVLLAIPRKNGTPQAADRKLWSDLQILLDSSTELVDLLVVGPDSYWSAREAA
jgi:DNA repair protein RadC